jgi:hypothetical protein
VTNRDEDELWRSIVDNYGDRPQLADEALPAGPPPASAPSSDEEPVAPAEDEERFVPPPPPPLPRPENKRLVAWVGVLGVPILLLILLLVSMRPPTLVAYALVAWFVGGFTYLVLLMPRGPRDPDDDGARL